MAQLHAASERGSGNVVLTGSDAATVREGLERHGLLRGGGGGTGTGTGTPPTALASPRGGEEGDGKEDRSASASALILDPGCRDEARMVHDAHRWAQGRAAAEDTGLRRTVRKLVDCAVVAVQRQDAEGEAEGGGTSPASRAAASKAEKEPGLVLMAYSRSTIDVAQALQDWKDMASRTIDPGDVEDLLKRAVTVVTVGTVSDRFPDGPAYLHVHMSDDPLVEALGCCSTNRERGGRDAVYLEASSPYRGRPNTVDAHNMGACVVQFLSVLLRVNGTRTFRGLYNLASQRILSDLPPSYFMTCQQSTAMDVPPNLEDELIPAMIRATGGDRWLWDSGTSLGLDCGGGGGDDDDDVYDDYDYVYNYDDDDDDYVYNYGDCPIPTEEEADMILEHQYGYDAYDEIAVKSGGREKSMQ